MIVSAFYCIIAGATTIYLMFSMLQFTRFLSFLKVPENDTDATTFTLFTIDVCLVVLFMAQHSGLASTTYRKKLDDWGLTPIARSVYVLSSALMLQLLMYLWEPITEVHFWVIDISDSPLLAFFFTVLHVVLWIIFFIQVLIYEPLHLIGLKQVYHHIKNLQTPQSYLHPRLRLLLTQMPHSGAGCFIAILWLQPYMTFDRMILATVFTAYLCCSFTLSEKDYQFVKKCSWSTKTVHSVSYRSKRDR
ncbi:nurim-like isoform X1 [Mercenaria mercenaria]|uniref:nurim-like isoform X1 n=1 Tax=Mercenaria mercenaria TaxID=6596 RepID=UPI001E1D233C|nr:nurim-like isoform X1 [Mercenaria mercenaria]